MNTASVAWVALLFLLTACANGGAEREQVACARDAQCPPGEACADGRCVPRLGSEGVDDAQVRVDAGQPDFYVFPDGPTDDALRCSPNGNGRIERDELMLKVPSSLAIRVHRDVRLDLSGKGAPAGGPRWDLSVLSAGSAAKLGTDPLPAWCASDFPPAAYASELAADYGVFSKTRLLGVLEAKASALQLLGLVSDKATHTKIRYSRPLDLLRFPIAVGDSYSTTALATGYSDLFPVVSYSERYEIDVLARGKLRVVAGLVLDALLVRARQQIYQPLMPIFAVKTTAFLFVVECYGTVARLIAKGDPGADLSAVDVRELWRLAPL